MFSCLGQLMPYANGDLGVISFNEINKISSLQAISESIITENIKTENHLNTTAYADNKIK